MINLQREINDKINTKRLDMLENGISLKGKQKKVVESILNEYDLSDYEVMNTMPFFIQLKPIGTREKMKVTSTEQLEMTSKLERFKKRVKSGQVEKSISNWIEKHHSEFEIRHSRSIVNSESFYIYEKGSETALVKLSLHNTISQEIEHGTPFIDLNNYISVVDLKKDIEKRLA